MSILKDALNGLNLEDLKRECNPKEEIKPHWNLEYLGRLGRPTGISFKTVKGKTNEHRRNKETT
jgi:hypothetical protein